MPHRAQAARKLAQAGAHPFLLAARVAGGLGRDQCGKVRLDLRIAGFDARAPAARFAREPSWENGRFACQDLPAAAPDGLHVQAGHWGHDRGASAPYAQRFQRHTVSALALVERLEQAIELLRVMEARRHLRAVCPWRLCVHTIVSS
jgi:hypothetical protein